MTDRSQSASDHPEAHEWIIESLINMAAYAEKYGLNQLHNRLVDAVCEAASGELAKETQSIVDRKYLCANAVSNVVLFRSHGRDM